MYVALAAWCQIHPIAISTVLQHKCRKSLWFCRRDIYAGMVCTLADIRFEMVAILYNIGALHSQLGASDSRVTADGMKLSCTHFQCAAWAFQVLFFCFLFMHISWKVFGCIILWGTRMKITKLEGLNRKPYQMEETHWEVQNFSEIVAPQEEEEYFEVFTPAIFKSVVYWDMTLCSLVDKHHFKWCWYLVIMVRYPVWR